jgi:hypothetical protein
MKAQYLGKALTATMAISLASYLTPAPAGTFVHAIGGSGNEGLVALGEYDDDEFVAVGYTDSYDAGNTDVLLMRFDFRGNIRWTEAVGRTASDEAYWVITTSDGNIVVTGRTRSAGAGDWDAFLAKFTPDGNPIWARTLGGDRVDEGFCVLEAQDGDLVVAGDTKSRSDGERWDVLLAKFDANGDLVWDTEAFSLARANWGYRVVEMPDHGLLVAGGTASGVLEDQDILIAKFDVNGHVDWGWRIGEAWPYWEWARGLIQTSEWGYALSGWSEDDMAGSSSFILKLDSAVGIEWGRIVPGPASYWNQAPGLTETRDGGLAVAGSYYYPGSSYDVWLAKWDAADGAPLWSRRFGGQYLDEATAVVEDTCGCLMVVGGTASFGADPPNALWARCTRDGKSCLDDLGGPSSSQWSPPEGAAPLAEVHQLEVHSWYPDVTPIDPPVTEVCLRCPGDINCDGRTDLEDLAALLALYGKCEGDPDYNPCADLNGDGCVDLQDLAILLSDYGCEVDP